MKWSFSDPAGLVRFDAPEGSAFIDDRRILLLDSESLRQVRRALVQSMGPLKAAGILSNWGYSNGYQDAVALEPAFERRGKKAWFNAGVELLALRGFAHVNVISENLGDPDSEIIVEAEWRNPWEIYCRNGETAEEWLRGCATVSGYLSGFATAVAGRPATFLETRCCAREDERCYALAKSEWSDDDEEVRSVGRLAQQISQEKVSVPELIAENEPVTERIRTLITELEAQRAEIKTLQSQVQYLQEIGSEGKPVNEMIGKSAPYRRALRDAQRVAATDSTVLLHGETGTGKELFARYIHANSPHSSRPFVTVNCAALPSSLVESELFGHERGAFTGAVQRKLGRFEIANGGTIFLDEIGELPLETQAKFLRVLQEGEFERVGGNQTIKVKARVLAATNRDLEELVDEGTFRADLFYRLNVFPIRIPPLRERGSDLVLLVNHFAQKFRKQFHKPITSVSTSSIDRLREYDFPGNVRELQHLIERSVLLSEGEVLEIVLPLERKDEQDFTRETGEPFTLAQMEKRYIESVLRRTGGAIAGPGGAAEILDLPPSTLRSRMKKLGIRK